MLRGGFGYAFRRLACAPQCRDSAACSNASSCPYKLIFEPSPTFGADRLTKNQDIPRPFVFRPSVSSKTHFEKGEAFEFDLVLIGRAVDYLPHFVLSLCELSEGGLGLNRARCRLDRVESLGQSSPASSRSSPVNLIYSSEDNIFRSPEAIGSNEWIEGRSKHLITDRQGTLTIKFLTPTLVRADGQVIREPEFHHIFKRLRDRINSMSTFFGNGPLDVDFRGLGERSEKIGKIGSRFEWCDRDRTSSKTGQRHEISGFTGEATFHGELDEFIPWLVMGEMLHVGKHTAWGNGRFELDCSALRQHKETS